MTDENGTIWNIADKELIAAPEEHAIDGEILENDVWRKMKGLICIEHWLLNDWLLRLLPLLTYITEQGSGFIIYYPRKEDYSRVERISLVSFPLEKSLTTYHNVNVIGLTSDYLSDFFQLNNPVKLKTRLREILEHLGLPENEVTERKYHVKLCEDEKLPIVLYVTDSFDNAKTFINDWLTSNYREV